VNKNEYVGVNVDKDDEKTNLRRRYEEMLSEC